MKRFMPLARKVMPYIGAIGVIASIVAFVARPSWPTPDKLFVFMVCSFMMFHKATEILKRFGPFIVTLLIYESFRGLVPHLNTRVEYMFMVHVDRFLGFGTLPTTLLQNLLWDGNVRWFDTALYIVYMLHFVLPITVALFLWRHIVYFYWRYVLSFLVVSFMGFFTFLAMPAAPPWMASEKGYIEPITRVSSSVWYSLGIQDFPSVYNKISPNPVAAVPSLHAAYATLLCIFCFKAFGKKWGLVALVYPILIYFMTVYQGEHYLVDELIGSLYAVIAYLVIIKWYPVIRAQLRRVSLIRKIYG